MNQNGWLVLILLLCLPVLTCSVFPTENLDATATHISAEIFAKMTSDIPVAADTSAPTLTSIPTLTPPEVEVRDVEPAVEENPAPTNTSQPEQPDVPEGPALGPITFARGLTADNQLIDPGTEFPADITEIYACYEFWGMGPELQFSQYWYYKGKEFISGTRKWDLGKDGATCSYITYDEGKKGYYNGTWEVKLYIGNNLAQSGTFNVGN